MTKIVSKIFFFVTMFGRIIAYNLKLPIKLTFHSPHKNQKWFIKFDEYPGPVEHLEMVGGAEKMCQDIFDDQMFDPYEHPHQFTVTVTNKFDDRKALKSYKLKILESNISIWAGRFYQAYSWDNTLHSWRPGRIIWLCPVVLYTFGCYPKRIYMEVTD